METSRLNKYIHFGWKDKHWYEDCEKLFTELYGRDRLKLVTQLFAATSINSSLKSNVRLFRKALHELEHGLPFTHYLPVMLKQLNCIREGRPLSGRKINAFANAMSGDTNAVVVDIWLLRAFGEDRKYFRANDGRVRSGGATEKQFNMIEAHVRELAHERGVDPRQMSAIIWSGTRIVQSGNRLTRYDDVLRLQEYNMYEKRIQANRVWPS